MSHLRKDKLERPGRQCVVSMVYSSSQNTHTHSTLQEWSTHRLPVEEVDQTSNHTCAKHIEKATYIFIGMPGAVQLNELLNSLNDLNAIVAQIWPTQE